MYSSGVLYIIMFLVMVYVTARMVLFKRGHSEWMGNIVLPRKYLLNDV